MKYAYLVMAWLLSQVALAQQVLTQRVADGNQIAPRKFQTRENLPPALKLNPVDVKTLLREDQAEAGQNVPFRFGKAMLLDLDAASAGRWQTVEGGRVWQLVLTSPGAYSLNFLFDKFSLPDGAELYLYNRDRSIAMGPITAAQNNKFGSYATDLIPGDEVLFELFEPTAVSGESRLHLARAVHGYKNVFGSGKLTKTAGRFGESASCNVDINCPAGSGWQNEANATAMVLLGNGDRLCSGALLNNACQDLTPNFLTAFHCVDVDQTGNISTAEQDQAQNWVFRFNYRSTGCNGGEGYNYLSISGSQLVAAYYNTDFALVRLNSAPSANSGITYAGWSRSAAPAASSASIHHPAGDVMKIALASTAAQPVDFVVPARPAYGPNTHWRVNFSTGTVQPGSSGAPLFDQDHRVVGQLHGDQNNKGDYCGQHLGEYGRFDQSWAGGGTPATRLQDWLTTDPNVMQVGTVTPTITGPDVVCYQTATFQVAASNVTWRAEPASLFTVSSGSGSQFSTAEASGMQGTGTITATATSCGTGRTVTMTRTVRVGTESSGYYSGGGKYNVQLQTVQFVPGGGQYTITMNEPYNFTFSSNSASIPVYQSGSRSAYFTLPSSNGAGTQITASAVGAPCGLVGHFTFAVRTSPYYRYGPNPASTELMVVATDQASENQEAAPGEAVGKVADRYANVPVEAALYNSSGILVRSQYGEKGKVVFDTHNLPNGLYFLRTGQGKEAVTQHIQITH